LIRFDEITTLGHHVSQERIAVICNIIYEILSITRRNIYIHDLILLHPIPMMNV